MTEEEFAALQAEKEALLNKNRELLSELRAAKNKNKEIDPENYSKVLDENDTLKSELSKLKNDLGLKTKDFEKLNGQLLEKDNYLKNLTLENSLNDHLSKLNIASEKLGRLKKSFLADAKVTDDGVMIEGKPISDYMAQWAGSDEGKSFTLAPANSGGGATGSNGTATVTGNLSGSKSEQEAYIKQKFNL